MKHAIWLIVLLSIGVIAYLWVAPVKTVQERSSDRDYPYTADKAKQFECDSGWEFCATFGADWDLYKHRRTQPLKSNQYYLINGKFSSLPVQVDPMFDYRVQTFEAKKADSVFVVVQRKKVR